jgi:hypothetical protein
MWKGQKTQVFLGISMASVVVGAVFFLGACQNVDCTLPWIIDPDAGCCSYTWQDDLHADGVTYRQPGHVFSSDEEASAFIKKLDTGGVNIRPPYAIGTAEIGQGWHYDNGGFHAGIDYSRSDFDCGQDPTFEARAAADGVIVSKHWDDWVGNMVIIEHYGSDGTPRFRSMYAHLRDGFSHDLAMAQLIPASAVGAPGDNTDKYRKYAQLSPNPLFWGTETQKIQVEPGVKVSYGELIGWTGDTGPGGAGNGLNADGTPASCSGNVHLHYMLSVPDPKNPGDWVFVDPYGVYQEASSGCYDPGVPTPFTRLIQDPKFSSSSAPTGAPGSS